MKNLAINSSFGRGVLVLVLVLVVALSIACQRSQADGGGTPGAPARASVPNAPVAPASVAAPKAALSLNLRTYSGEVRAKDQVSLVPRITGALRIMEIRVAIGDRVKAGDVVAVLDHQTLDAAVGQAEAALSKAQTNLKKMQAGPRPEQVAVSQAAVDTAQARLDALVAGSTREQIAAAQATLAGSQAKLNQALAGATPEQIRIQENQLDLARKQRIYQEALADMSLNPPGGKAPSYNPSIRDGVLDVYDQQVEIAISQLESLKAPPSPELVAQLRSAVDAAQAQLDAFTAKPKATDIAQLQSSITAARAQLDLARAPYTEYDLASAQADVASAEAALLTSKANQAEAYLRSPVDGFVGSRDLGIGALATTNTAVATVVSRDVEVVFSVEEKSVGQITKGMAVAVTTSADQIGSVKGQVVRVSPSINKTTRTFDVYLSVDPGAALVPGMFATVSLSEAPTR